MKVKECYNNCVVELSGLFTVSEAGKMAEILFEDLLHIERKKILFSDDEISPSQATIIEDSVERLKKQEPIQYITGIAHFMDFILKVNHWVLIPRPETEELIEYVVKDIKETILNAIDIGTGSGCIAIVLKRIRPGWNITALDVSKGAIETATENAKQLGQAIEFIHDDLKDATFDAEKFDVIVSNPPYITYAEKSAMSRNVVDYEPHIALFEPEEFYFYKLIISFAVKYLANNGWIFVEINQDKALKLRDLFMSYFNAVEIRKDISGNYRFLKAGQMKNNFLPESSL